MNFTLKIICWKCKRPFHISEGIDDNKELSGVLVEAIKPCPYHHDCGKPNLIKVDAALVATLPILKETQQTESPRLVKQLPSDAFLGQTIVGEEPQEQTTKE